MKKDPQVIRRSFGLKEAIQGQLESHYHSPLIERIRENGYHLEVGSYEIFLAREFGFCHGVERAINLAYETLRRFPDRRIYITAEMIHNPNVNENLRKMGYRFLDQSADLEAELQQIKPGDIVLVPAFGTNLPYFNRLKDIGCVLVDTTCGEVMRVWVRVERYAREDFTAVIHGKYYHEETIATSSRAGKFLIVRDSAEAQKVCDYIEGRIDREAFMGDFEKACSGGFDPDHDLERIGVANQTTMLKDESLQIAGMLEASLAKRYGTVEGHFMSFDTICSATQDRQDAMGQLLEEGLDLMLVVGGFNSSNTGHLCEIAGRKVPSFHINNADCLESLDRLKNQPVGHSEPVIAESWFPDGARKIGFTAGASTPNSILEGAISRLLKLLGHDNIAEDE